MACDHRLVGGDHGLAGLNCLKDQGAGRFDPPDHLHHDVHCRVVDHGCRIGGQHGIGQLDGTAAFEITYGNADQLQVLHQGMTLLGVQQDRSHPATHGAQTQQADADPCSHSLSALMER